MAASAPRPWYVGPVALGLALFTILNAPSASGEAVRALIGRGWQFTTTVLGDDVPVLPIEPSEAP